VRRREFITLLSGAAAWPLAARAQQPGKLPRIGVLWHAATAEDEKIPLSWIQQGLKDFGYVDGQNILLEHRYPAERADLFQKFAVELAELNVDLMIAVTRPAAIAAQRATKTIPIVFIVVPNPVDIKLVASLAKPGGNITGLSTMGVELTPKRIELLKEAVGDLSRVALIVNMSDPEGARRDVEVSRDAAAHLGVTLHPIEVRGPDDFERAFSVISQDHIQAVVLSQNGLFYAERRQIARLAQERRLPVMAFTNQMAMSGTFMSYGPNSPAIFRRSGYFVDKILKGSKPADLPVEQPTKFELYINGNTAKRIGLTVPPQILARADEVIE